MLMQVPFQQKLVRQSKNMLSIGKFVRTTIVRTNAVIENVVRASVLGSNVFRANIV